jgi:hypothetical protein
MKIDWKEAKENKTLSVWRRREREAIIETYMRLKIVIRQQVQVNQPQKQYTMEIMNASPEESLLC